MSDFRYGQLCPLACAAEILGERWTLLVIRELFCGPQRFSDLRRRLPGLSSSVLADRLAKLEARGIVERREWPPPAATQVYALGEAGRALERPLFELMRWGLRWLDPQPGDHHEPDWTALGLRMFARRDPSPARRMALALTRDAHDGEPVRRLWVAGGPGGTRVSTLEADAPPPDHAPPDCRITGPSLWLLAAASGRAPVRALVEAGTLRVEGDLDAVDDLPALFDFSPAEPPASAAEGRA